MTRPIADLDQHPDILELRARYDRAAETPTAHVTDGGLMLAGLYLALSPWIIGFAGIESDLAVNNFICGAVVVALAAGFTVAYGRTHGLTWVPVVIGVWTFVAPWVIEGARPSGGAIANNIVISLVVIALGLLTMRLLGMRDARGGERRDNR
ncbi:SPW repeat protein [Dactylosporangium aurantiacum]|uniref:SPW repeat protein n=1 Tax=Dactylosporangium aurantiacum TaxID=35754 RepID=A0A9Q9IBA0_9ACTN|nr:SPW repeat protein [Dactylosporangium aurantiacum]MDG6109686.1 SPW repeat protein [Dactylosporangium aurantiacum]UWZ50299.1 SPW repeat protein [Dactylosporangium aurantiacum]